LNTVLGGLKKVTWSADNVLDALRAGGPATTDEIERRFHDALESALGDRDHATARVVIE
jgi:hypothetical protein